MPIEIEAKFLDIDPTAIRARLQELGARLVYPERLMRRKTFDDPARNMKKIGAWVRVRDEGNVITLSYKRVESDMLHGMSEITVEVNDFEKTCELLLAIGLVQKSYQETKREKWMLDGVEITIDTWPWIPPFVEIEAETEDLVNNAALALNLDWEQRKHGGVDWVYPLYYNVTAEAVDTWLEITFTPVPDWLQSKKK